MIDSLFQAGTDEVLDDQVQRPKAPVPTDPSFKIGDALKAPFQGVASGATKTAAFGAEIAGAFGSVAGQTGAFNSGGMFSIPGDDERKQQEAGRRALLDNGPQYSNAAADTLRQRAQEVMPDPKSTHAAAQVIAGMAEFATQAVGYTAAGGAVVGPALLAGDAGFSEADKLKQQGVDLGTRAAAGAVAGGLAGASIGLPVVGKTVAGTAALVAAGGPGSFITQQAAEKAILDHAGYDKIASQYDPLDPVGLALSSVVPAVFGGVALRSRANAKLPTAGAPTLRGVVQAMESNGRETDSAGNVLTSPAGAKGSMQVMDATNRDPGFGVRPAADNSPAERKRVGEDYIDALVKHYGSEDKALAAYNAGPGRLDAAVKKAGDGGDWLALLPKETQDYVANGIKRLGGERVASGARAAVAGEPDVVAAARVRQVMQSIDDSRLTPDSDIAGISAHQDALETAHGQLARGEPVEVSDIVRLDDSALLERQPVEIIKRRGVDLVDVAATTATLPPVPEGHIRLFRAESPTVKFGDVFDASQLTDIRGAGIPGARYTPDLAYADYYRASYGRDARVHFLDVPHDIADKGKIDDTEYKIERSLVARAVETLQGARELNSTITSAREVGAVDTPAREVPTNKSASEPGKAPAEARPTPGKGAAPAKPGEPPVARPQQPNDTVSTSDETQAAAALDSRSAEAIAETPDLVVQLEGREPMKASELLEAVRREAEEETQDASLVQVAAECFLRG